MFKIDFKNNQTFALFGPIIFIWNLFELVRDMIYNFNIL